jgi:uncharacterized protein involved in exopolysaccharide biosynthesis
MTPETKSLKDYLAAIARRRWLLIGTFVAVAAVALSVAFGLPSVYRSHGTILIEQQEIPQDLVQTTVTGFADQRIQLIRQRVMTTANLLGIVERYNLYAEDREREPSEVVVENMREAINVEVMSADIVDRSGRATKATIAFTVSFEDESPQLAQRVANELVTLYLNENVKTRTELATEASAFLGDESKRLAGTIEDLEARLATFKERNANLLPELAEFNRQLLERTLLDVTTAGREVGTLEERRALLKGQIAQTEEMYRFAAGPGGHALTPAERLAALEEEYARLSARYKSDHPDVTNLSRELQAMREAAAHERGRAASRALQAARADLAELERRYGPEHPDVERAQRTVARLEEQAPRNGRSSSTDGHSETLRSPAALQLQTQLDAVEVDLGATRERRQELERRLKEYEGRVTQAPQVEREYRVLTRDLENAVTKYRELKAKELQAQMAQSLETERKGERFTLIEPPLQPEEPVKPNRPAIAFVGLVLALGSAVGAVALAEQADTTLRGYRAVARVSGALPLAAIPYMSSPADRRRRRRRVAGTGALAAAAGVAAAAAVHFLFMPLDVLWYAVLRKLGA